MGNRSNRQEVQFADEWQLALSASLQEAPLPIGWEESRNEKGDVYYIDHLSQTTSFSDPRIIQTNRKKKLKKKRLPKYSFDFYSQTKHFVARLHAQRIEDGSPLVISVRREMILEDSFEFLNELDVYTLSRRLFVKFEGENGLDYGGMSREWFMTLSEKFLDDKYQLFLQRNAYTYVIHPRAMHQPRALEYFNFIGQLIGLAIFHGCLFKLYFPTAFYHSLLNLPVELPMLKSLDKDVYNSLNYIKNEDDIEDLELTFSVLEDESNYELKPGGSEIDVDENNKEEYLALCLEHFLGLYEEPMNAIKDGITKFIPFEMLSEFSPNELRLIINGSTKINIDDLKKNTEYEDMTENTDVVKFFWEVMSELTQKELRKFLHFTTGSEKVPVGGFAHLQGSTGIEKFNIRPKFSYGLPIAHSCFNRLELPLYSTVEELREKLLFAIHETEGFELE